MSDSKTPPRNDHPESLANRSLVEKITAAVAAETNTASDELDSIYECIDPDALEALFASTLQGTLRTNGKVLFHYAGCQVTVNANRTVEVDSLKNPDIE
ncbi:HalOD1 output domain-containing protein [Haladaptatus sp. NG-SE-30]